MKKPKLVIIDYGVGNVFSIFNSLDKLGLCRVEVSSTESQIKSADALILPGVGAFEACLENFQKNGLMSFVGEAVQIKKKPILGICVGMQLMANYSEENGRHQGLGWIPGQVVKINNDGSFPVPHVGWNNVKIKKNGALFSRLSDSPHFYFDHSYHFACEDEHGIATCDYGIELTAAIAHQNIFGVQFHPEKSQLNGLRLFRGFLNVVIAC
jgi:glutamine amidotransferase